MNAFHSCMAALAFSASVFGSETAPPSVEISHEGKALLPVVVAPDASPEVRALADTLASGLGRITGGSFAVETGDAPHGILLGTDRDWPGLLPPPKAGLPSTLTREDYLLRTQGDQLQIIGRTALGVQDAVWDFFYRAGFRQFLPGPKWEIWPRISTFAPGLEVRESPSYYTRKLRVGSATWRENTPATVEWKKRNRMVSGFTLASGHAYDRLIENEKAFFAEHPEAIVGSGRDRKLDPSQPGLLDIAADDAIGELTQNPNRDSVSMEPSDGGGWRADSPLGSPSNQAVTLANHVARAIQEKFPGRKIGIYAYNQHSPAPTVPVDPNLIVSVATAFIQGGNTAEGLMKEWRKMGAELGVREYLSVAPWDMGLPGLSRATDLDYIARTIPLFHQLGARYWDGETTDAWGVHGLGYFITARLLWNVREAARLPELLDDFYTRSFGGAALAMRDYFSRYLLKSGRPLLSEDLVGRMYRTLGQALEKGDTPEIAARIEDFVLYTRYVELMIAFKNSGEANRKSAYDAMARFVWRGRGTFMFDRWTVFREIPGRQFKIKREDLGKWVRADLVPEGPFTSGETRELLREGIANNKIVSFDPVSFSSNLVPFPASGLLPTSSKGFVFRNATSLYVNFTPGGEKALEFEVTGGLVLRNGEPLQVRLFSSQNVNVDQPVAEMTVPSDKASHPVRLESPFSGLHRLEIRDGSAGFSLNWPVGQRVALPASPEESSPIQNPWHAVFFVPRASKVVGGYSASRTGRIVTAKGRVVWDFAQMAGPGYFSVEVPEGEDGTSWEIQGARGKKLLLTVPPYFARSQDELLVPAEALGTRKEEP